MFLPCRYCSHHHHLLLLLLFLLPPSSSLVIHTISSSSPPWLPTSNLTLLSPNSVFAAGFLPRQQPAAALFTFSIWVQASTPKTIVWSLKGRINSTSPLAISPSGLLSLHNPHGIDLLHHMSTNTTPNLTLEDSGELVFGNWSSFNSPTDTILANQSIPRVNTTLRSGRYRLVNASYLDYNGSDIYWQLDGALVNLTADGLLQKEKNGIIFAYDKGELRLRRLTLDPDGNLRLYSLDNRTSDWVVSWQAVVEHCLIHGTCGQGYVCVPTSSGSPTCRCPPGYTDKRESTNTDLNQDPACRPRIEPLVQPKFLRMDFVDYDQPSGLSADHTPLDFAACRSRCLRNTSCAAFAYKFDGSWTCIHRGRPLVNGYWSPVRRIATYVKVAGEKNEASNYTGMEGVFDGVCGARVELQLPPTDNRHDARNIGILAGIFGVELLAGFAAFWAFLRKYSRYREMARTFGLELMPAAGPRRFSYSELKGATCNFSQVLGRGAFGVVYKGELPDKRSIAVKKLRDVSRGEAEFWAEVSIIARMHHLNLVRLWGFCVEKHERMLVYEFVPNGSLSKYLLNSDGPLLKWSIRYRIAVGVARAIAYLHEECSDWVLHCDIKPDNILLMHDFCPKVADFGLAKLTSKEEKVKMSTIRGTRGYMAPEWFIKGSDSITSKADVYSFGMVLLDLIGGRRQWDFHRESLESVDCYFPSWAFDKVFEGRLEEIIDERIAEDFDVGAHTKMVEMMARTAMWCLQDNPSTRPSMGKVVKMLEGTIEITKPERITLAFGGDDGARSVRFMER